jgi:sugar diacid utilization regulator
VNLTGPVTVREIMTVLRRWQVRLLAGEAGLLRHVTWASTMRARLPAFEGLQGGEIAMLALPVLRALHAQGITLSLARVIEQLDEMGVSAVVAGGIAPDVLLSPEEQQMLVEATELAETRGIPLLALPNATLSEVEHDLIAHFMTRRDHQLQSVEPSAADAARLRAGLRSEALEALLTGTYASETSMRARAFQLGYDLAQAHAVLWVDLAPHLLPLTHPLGPRGADPVALHLANELAVVLGAWARPRETQVAALVPLAGMERGTADLVEQVARVLTRILNPDDKNEWSAAISEPAHEPAEVHTRANEARDIAKLGLLILGPRHIARSSDLGVYQLLLSLRETGQLAPFVEQTLGPLLADARNGTRLIETLDAFLTCNGNLQETARRLHLHRNSLTYRLTHAGKLLGRDLDDPELRLALQLAIKGRRIIAL